MTLTAGLAALDFTLPDVHLADVDGKVSNCYGVRQEREVDGVRRADIVHSTFIVDRKGIHHPPCPLRRDRQRPRPQAPRPDRGHGPVLR
jgi:peroxiredoxin